MKKASISVTVAKKQVAMIVHCGLPRTLLKLLLCVPNYCARKIWKKLSISIVGIKRKLRRLSSVGIIFDFGGPSAFDLLNPHLSS
jgi:hypothetical protein